MSLPVEIGPKPIAHEWRNAGRRNEDAGHRPGRQGVRKIDPDPARISAVFERYLMDDDSAFDGLCRADRREGGQREVG